VAIVELQLVLPQRFGKVFSMSGLEVLND